MSETRAAGAARPQLKQGTQVRYCVSHAVNQYNWLEARISRDQGSGMYQIEFRNLPAGLLINPIDARQSDEPQPGHFMIAS